mgnify:CR=1 FL=1
MAQNEWPPGTTKIDVGKSIEEVRAQHASMKSVERNLKSGDFIHADFSKLQVKSL